MAERGKELDIWLHRPSWLSGRAGRMGYECGMAMVEGVLFVLHIGAVFIFSFYALMFAPTLRVLNCIALHFA